jgi:hypothetical protein
MMALSLALLFALQGAAQGISVCICTDGKLVVVIADECCFAPATPVGRELVSSGQPDSCEDCVDIRLPEFDAYLNTVPVFSSADARPEHVAVPANQAAVMIAASVQALAGVSALPAPPAQLRSSVLRI